ncbi:MAG: hypothetical protein ACRD0B_12550 [Acidimicrobiales bacterium]
MALDGVGQRGPAELCSSFSPRSVPLEAARFASEVVGRAGPNSPARAKALLFACSRLAAYGLSVGLQAKQEVLFTDSVIERFVICGTAGLSPASVRTLRTNLRALARAIEARPPPLPVGLPRERAKRPYSPAEIAAYLHNAACQSTLARRMRANGLICLGAGAGLKGSELRGLRGSDVVFRSGGLVVLVRGRRERTVPVLPAYHERLVAAASYAGDGYVIGGENPERLNVTTRLVSSLSGGAHLSRLDTGRLRSTWLSECARRIGLGAFMAAAGVSCSQRLGDVVSSL